MSSKNVRIGARGLLAAGFLAAGISFSGAWAQSGESAAPAAASLPAASTPGAPPRTTGAPYRFQPNRFSKRARMFYEGFWGVDSLSVKAVESGEIIRFSYRVLDGDKALALNDKKVDPALICPEKGVKLIVPSMEKVGQLRQSSTPEPDKSYWMAFSNAGRVVKRGDRVNVVIGNFHAENLVVE